jgi:hypothetical protein
VANYLTNAGPFTIPARTGYYADTPNKVYISGFLPLTNPTSPGSGFLSSYDLCATLTIDGFEGLGPVGNVYHAGGALRLDPAYALAAEFYSGGVLAPVGDNAQSVFGLWQWGDGLVGPHTAQLPFGTAHNDVVLDSVRFYLASSGTVPTLTVTNVTITDTTCTAIGAAVVPCSDTQSFAIVPTIDYDPALAVVVMDNVPWGAFFDSTVSVDSHGDLIEVHDLLVEVTIAAIAHISTGNLILLSAFDAASPRGTPPLNSALLANGAGDFDSHTIVSLQVPASATAVRFEVWYFGVGAANTVYDIQLCPVICPGTSTSVIPKVAAGTNAITIPIFDPCGDGAVPTTVPLVNGAVRYWPADALNSGNGIFGVAFLRLLRPCCQGCQFSLAFDDVTSNVVADSGATLWWDISTQDAYPGSVPLVGVNVLENTGCAVGTGAWKSDPIYAAGNSIGSVLIGLQQNLSGTFGPLPLPEAWANLPGADYTQGLIRATLMMCSTEASPTRWCFTNLRFIQDCRCGGGTRSRRQVFMIG